MYRCFAFLTTLTIIPMRHSNARSGFRTLPAMRSSASGATKVHRALGTCCSTYRCRPFFRPKSLCLFYLLRTRNVIYDRAPVSPGKRDCWYNANSIIWFHLMRRSRFVYDANARRAVKSRQIRDRLDVYTMIFIYERQLKHYNDQV